MAPRLLQNVPRMSRNLNLGQEVRARRKPVIFSASFGIIGGAKVGKKSLALRFSHMDAEVPEMEEGKTFFNSFHKIKLPYSRRKPVWMHLAAHICPPPEIHGVGTSTYQLQSNFCCFVFLFDVTNRASFILALVYMSLHAGFTTDFLVGHKSDLRGSVSRRTAVPLNDAHSQASSHGARYYECSSRTKENVQVVLEAVQDCALFTKYEVRL